MVVSRGIARLAIAAGVCGAILCAPVLAQPLVTGDLTIYYDFDDFTNTVMDKSGNNFHGKVQDGTRKMLDGTAPRTELTTTGVITNDKSNPKRGAGAIRFTQTSDTWMDPLGSDPTAVVIQDPVFVDMDGGVIKANHPDKLPKEAVTYAAWVNLEPVNATNQWNSPASIFQGSTATGHGNPHIHAEGSGNFRVALRDDAGAGIVSSNGAPWSAHPFPNQPDIDATGAAPELWPENEWFHLAVTYDKNADNGNGFYALYYNGEVIQSGPPNQQQGADLGEWALREFDSRPNYYDGLGLGAVYDSGGRRIHGMLDEVYIFTRALSEAEIDTLVNIAPPAGLSGDYNNNGTVDAADYVLWRDGGPLQNEGDTPGTVNQADYEVWRANFGGGAAAIGAAASVPEPATIAMLLACLSVAAARRRR
jgi:hypothetical protein